jgi:phosphoribosylformimino-5-aminoimidazole carboxamide ribotide isomerase
LFEVIPAIDLRGGRCVRLLKGSFDSETVYGNDPVAIALRWQAEGANRLHVVDLDGAKYGAPMQIETVQAICRVVAIPVQVGGGIRTLEDAECVLRAGASRVVIGTAVTLDERFAQALFERFGEQVALGLDVREDKVATHGWLTDLESNYLAFAKRIEQLGARRVVFTNISLDGTLEGVDLEPIKALLDAVEIPVIASGGVASKEDIDRLRELSPLGLEGVIVGKALYEDRVILEEL